MRYESGLILDRMPVTTIGIPCTLTLHDSVLVGMYHAKDCRHLAGRIGILALFLRVIVVLGPAREIFDRIGIAMIFYVFHDQAFQTRTFGTVEEARDLFGHNFLVILGAVHIT